MNKANVKSANFRIGKRTFFFDVNTAANKSNYLKITESRFVEDGKNRVRNTVILFPEDLGDFQKNLKEIAGFLN